MGIISRRLKTKPLTHYRRCCSTSCRPMWPITSSGRTFTNETSSTVRATRAWAYYSPLFLISPVRIAALAPSPAEGAGVVLHPKTDVGLSLYRSARAAHSVLLPFRVCLTFRSFFLFVSSLFHAEFYSEESVNNQGLECLRFLNEVISDFDAVTMHNKTKEFHLSLALQSSFPYLGNSSWIRVNFVT